MKPWLLHIIFAVILVASVANTTRRVDVLAESDDIAPAVIRIARSHGLILSEETMAEAPGSTLVFEAPACARPVLITLLSVTFEEEPLIRRVGGQGDVVRYLYLDRSWNAPDRLAAFLEWKRHKALGLLNLTQYVPSRYMLRLSAPPSCEIANTIDWRAVWRRDYLMQPNPG
jgi:hypothetical protein